MSLPKGRSTAGIIPTLLQIQSRNGLRNVTIRPMLWPGVFTPNPITVGVCGEQQKSATARPTATSANVLNEDKLRFSCPSVSWRIKASLTSVDACRFVFRFLWVVPSQAKYKGNTWHQVRLRVYLMAHFWILTCDYSLRGSKRLKKRLQISFN